MALPFAEGYWGEGSVMDYYPDAFWDQIRFVEDLLWAVEEAIGELFDLNQEELVEQCKNTISLGVVSSLEMSELDPGIRFDEVGGFFYPSGDKELDEMLVKEPLQNLDDAGYTEVSETWKQGLRALLKSQSDSKELKNAVRDVYEALEAFARIVCKKPKKKLGQLVDIFINALNLNQSYKKILKEYIDYACKFRHPEDDRPDYDYAEVEAFVYLTGLFIRLGIQKIK